MIGFIISLLTGGERPTHREARVQEAERAVILARNDLSALVSKDTRQVRKAFEDILAARDFGND